MTPTSAAIYLFQATLSASLTVCHAGGAEDPAQRLPQTMASPKPSPRSPDRGRAARSSAAAGALVHCRSALRGEVRARTSPAAGRHLEGARDVKKKQKTKNHYKRKVLCYKACDHSLLSLKK